MPELGGSPLIVLLGAGLRPACGSVENWAIARDFATLQGMSLLTSTGSRSPGLEAAVPASSEAKSVRGEVRFVSAEERTGLHGAITPRGLLAVEISDPPWFESATQGARRGKLREAIEWAIESALEANGAPPAGMSDVGDLDENLSDQLYRVRSIGVRGLALYIPHLAPLASLAGALDAEDSAVLRWWMAATGERPVVVLIDSANRSMGAYGPPTRLERLVGAACEGGPALPPPNDAPSGEGSAVSKADASADGPALGLLIPGENQMGDDAHVDCDAHSDAEAAASPISAPRVTADEAATVTDAATPIAFDGRVSDVSADAIAKDEAPSTDPKGPEKSPSKRMFTNRVVPLFPGRQALPAKSLAFIEKGHAVAASLDWRGFANELEVARGPKPLTIVERLFMSRYTPLVEAVVRKEADDVARRTALCWADNFARSYTDGFGALKITGKRPRMVLDAPQIGNQIARLHGAKATQLVLVDAMRFDLGVRVHDRMRDALSSQATCTERLLLWSALPTTTPTQLELLARGPDALSSLNPPGDREEADRGRSSASLRRIKLGGRDLLKLDLVESRLRESGPPLAERLDAMADEVAKVLALHAQSLAPRTLMFIFGDHGFRMESVPGGTLAGTSGGASPEEVLVPAFAWLIGDVH